MLTIYSAGLHRIFFAWLDQLEAFSTDQTTVDANSLSDLPPSTVDNVLNTMPLPSRYTEYITC